MRTNAKRANTKCQPRWASVGRAWLLFCSFDLHCARACPLCGLEACWCPINSSTMWRAPSPLRQAVKLLKKHLAQLQQQLRAQPPSSSATAGYSAVQPLPPSTSGSRSRRASDSSSRGRRSPVVRDEAGSSPVNTRDVGGEEQHPRSASFTAGDDGLHILAQRKTGVKSNIRRMMRRHTVMASTTSHSVPGRPIQPFDAHGSFGVLHVQVCSWYPF